MCSKHATKGMVCLKRRKMCEICGKKQATYAPEGEKARRCGACSKTEGWLLVSKRRCMSVEADGKTCLTSACYAEPGEKKAVACLRHKGDTMVNVRAKKCAEPGCGKHVTYGIGGHISHCSAHKPEGAETLKCKTCIQPGCTLHASFGSVGRRRVHCKAHIARGEIYLSTSPCDIDGCTKTASYNFKGLSPLRCAVHRDKGMVYIRGPASMTCKANGCDASITSRSSHNGYCIKCFVWLFPGEPVSTLQSVKEKYFRRFMKETFPETAFRLDRRIEGSNSHIRPDALIKLPADNPDQADGYVLVVEFDEKQHMWYTRDGESERTGIIFELCDRKPLVLIHFNPDRYIDENSVRHPSCFGPGQTLDRLEPIEPLWTERTSKLKERINYWRANKPTEMITEEFLFYNAKRKYYRRSKSLK